MQTVFPARAPITLPVSGSDALFPVGRIFCVGQNYAAHAREMGGNPERDPPFFFCKDADAVVRSGSTIPYPPGTQDFHHEVELVVALGAPGRAVNAAEAGRLIFGYAVGLDMTRRDVQAAAKKAGRPWSVAKNFPASAPVGTIVPAAQVTGLSDAEIVLEVNGAVRQRATLGALIWNVAEIIAALTRVYDVQAGDLIFTGTPEGVGPVLPGDAMRGRIAGLPELDIRVA